MKRLLPFALVILTHATYSQVAITKLDAKSIPAAIKYTGHIVDAVRWADSSGEHIVITSETGPTPNKSSEDDGSDAALYAYHYLVSPDSLQLTWRIYDFIKDCSVDIKASFVKNTFAVTDLNHDGKAEVWVVYKTVCHGDVSPLTMKIIMYEDNKKYAIRGSTRVQPAPGQTMGGEYTFDNAFKNGPEVFREYAKKLWAKNVVEKWD